MNNLPFAKPGQFYKGNLHTHSTNSDGRISVEALCKFYREHGYHFLSITDHFLDNYHYPHTDASAYHTPDFVTLHGAELHAGKTCTGELWHILTNGLPLDFARPTPDETGPEIAQRALATGAFVTVAHPAWYNLSEEDVALNGARRIISTCRPEIFVECWDEGVLDRIGLELALYGYELVERWNVAPTFHFSQRGRYPVTYKPAERLKP